MRTRFPIAIAILAVFGALTLWAYKASQVYVYQEGWYDSRKYDLLFNTDILTLPVALFLGILFGTFKYAKGKDKIIDGKIERHDEFMFIQHWTNALGIIVLLVTGVLLGFLFIPRTLVATQHVGFALNMHFVGILFFFFGASYYVTKGYFTGELKHMMPKKGDLKGMIGHYKAMLTRGKAPKEEKFLAAERVVFPAWIIGIAGITLTGVVKTLAHVISIPGAVMGVTTFLHGVFAIYMALMLIAHIFAAAIIPPSWPLLRSMITGKVTEKYVKHHHEKWYEEIKRNEEKENKKPVAG